MLKDHYPYYLANCAKSTDEKLSVFDKFTGLEVTQVSIANQSTLEQAIQAAAAAVEPLRKMATFERKAILEHCAARLQERAEILKVCVCIESGKPIREAAVEVEKLIETFYIAAEESIKIYGDIQPLDISPRKKGYAGFWMRYPIGAIAFISAFNLPLNLLAHKIAPSIAAGCPFILKPASLTPVVSLLIGEILAETALPKGAFSILPCSIEDAELLVTDQRLKLLCFSGSAKTGWAVKSRAGKKSVVLELGGNAVCIVDEGSNLDDVVDRLMTGAFYQSGQSCIPVQRILIHRSIYSTLKEKLLNATQNLKLGDPKDPDTFIGPMISENEAKKLEQWIKDAIQKGATLLCGGKRKGNLMEPAILEGIPFTQEINQDEAFGPVAILSSFDNFDEALQQVNNSRYDLQAGVFTQDLYKAQKAWNTLEVSGIIIGDVPSWRVEHMPYADIKDRALGREAVLYSIQNMTETKMVVIRN